MTKTIKDIIRNDTTFRNDVINVIIGLFLLFLIVVFHLNGYTTIALLVSILGFMWWYAVIILLVRWFFYGPIIIYRLIKYGKKLEEYNKMLNYRIWGNLTLGAFIVKDFTIPEIIYSCVDIKDLELENK